VPGRSNRHATVRQSPRPDPLLRSEPAATRSVESRLPTHGPGATNGARALPSRLSLRPLSAAPRASRALHRKPPNPHSRASPDGDPGDPRFWRKPSGWTSETHPGRLVGPPVARRTSSSGILPLIDTAREFGEKATRGLFVLRARPSTGVGGRVWSLRTLDLGVDAPSPERRDPLLASSSTLPSEQLSPSVQALEVRLVSVAELGTAPRSTVVAYAGRPSPPNARGSVAAGDGALRFSSLAPPEALSPGLGGRERSPALDRALVRLPSSSEVCGSVE
jgi:hypothetical protein